MSDLLTILVPCYNAERYLRRCTNSLESLSKDIHIIFVNDGSTDATSRLVNDWIENHPNALLIDKKNGGYPSAINVGLDTCDTKYVMFLGVDDEVVAHGINKIYDILLNNSPDILCFSTTKIYDDELNQMPIKDRITHYSKEGLFEMGLFDFCKENQQDSQILFTRDTSRCFKMSVIADIRYFGKIGVSADGCFSTLVASKAHSFGFINEEGYVWHLHHDSVSAQKKSLYKLIDEVSVWNMYFQNIQKYVPDIRIPKPIISHFLIYKSRVLNLKRNKGKSEIVQYHELGIKRYRAWLLKSHYLSLRSRMALLYPGIWLMLVKILKHNK